jgi:hypothetical protein
LEGEVGRTVVPDLGAAVEADDEGGGGGQAEGEAEVAAVDGLEGTVATEGGGDLGVALDDLGAQDAAVFGDSAVFTTAQSCCLTVRDSPSLRIRSSSACFDGPWSSGEP